MKYQLGIVGLVLGLTVFSFQSHAAPINFSDGVLANTDWAGSIVSQTGPVPSFFAQQVATGGNPDQYREVRHTYGGLGSIVTGHLRSGATYNPFTQGAIAELNFSFDFILFNGGASNAVAYGGLIAQGGSFYITGNELTTTANWVNKSLLNRIAASFNKVSGPGPVMPDFSANGDLIQFGFFASNGTGQNQVTSTHSGLDNWTVNITPIPEPTSQIVLVSGLTGLLFVRHNKRRHTRSIVLDV